MIRGIWSTKEVFIDKRLLLPLKSQKIFNHSPDGFAWGYGGSGPAQLALALLLEFVGETEAKKYYQKFKWNVIALLPQDDFELEETLVLEWIKRNVLR